MSEREPMTVVTSFGARGFAQYGKMFLRTFFEYWTRDVDLYVYVDDDVLVEADDTKRCRVFSLTEKSPACASFLARHRDNPIAHGKRIAPGRRWKRSALQSGYNYRYDAYKFCRKVFAVDAATRAVQQGKLYWIDADVVTRKHVPVWLLHYVLPDRVHTSHLDRPGYYSECGFIGYNLYSKKTHDFINEFAAVYADDTVFEFPEWHDSYVYDVMRRRCGLTSHPIISTRSHTPFEESVLGEYMIHLKGARKMTEVV